MIRLSSVSSLCFRIDIVTGIKEGEMGGYETGGGERR